MQEHGQVKQNTAVTAAFTGSVGLFRAYTLEHSATQAIMAIPAIICFFIFYIIAFPIQKIAAIFL